jgi:hypothetical protein
MSGSPAARVAKAHGILLKTCSETTIIDENPGILFRCERQRIFVITGRVER